MLHLTKEKADEIVDLLNLTCGMWKFVAYNDWDVEYDGTDDRENWIVVLDNIEGKET